MVGLEQPLSDSNSGILVVAGEELGDLWLGLGILRRQWGAGNAGGVASLGPTHQGCTERTFRKKSVALWEVLG